MKQGHMTAGSASSSKTATSSSPTLRLSSDLLMNAAAWVEEHICTPASKKVVKAVWSATEGASDHVYLQAGQARQLAEYLLLIGKPGATTLAEQIQSNAKHQGIFLDSPAQVSDLSVLLSMITEVPDAPLTVTFNAQVLAELKRCLELGSALPQARTIESFAYKDESATQNPDAFSGNVKVTADLLEDSFGWDQDVYCGELIPEVIEELSAIVGKGGFVIEVPHLRVQQIVDWLEQKIAQGDSNRIAEKIRTDVERLNSIKLGSFHWDYS
ncbi:hypothetical protein [Pseudomonas putida]|uniref:Uncharacterized protein n=1 Tax=Pseudomonas putida TaxID=303 RepID=A0A8I1EHI9_PSEPU|nr:hypothetical protein [Pseudomonas putida]MBI6885860.1 hypothetical protein [Pseudomonas putida]